MEFRWVALIALWTVFSGPVFGVPTARPPRDGVAASATAPKAAPVSSSTLRR